MSGGRSNACGKSIDPITIAKKIAVHSTTDPFSEKFLKYLGYVSVLKKTRSSTSARSSSPWIELRSCGALEGIMLALKKLFISEEINSFSEDIVGGMKPSKSTVDFMKKRERIRDVCNVALSVLSNAFALDYSVRAQVRSKLTRQI